MDEKPSILFINGTKSNISKLGKSAQKFDIRTIDNEKVYKGVMLSFEHEFSVVIIDVEERFAYWHHLTQELLGQRKESIPGILFINMGETEEVLEYDYRQYKEVDFLPRPLVPRLFRYKVAQLVQQYQGRQQLEKEIRDRIKLEAELRKEKQNAEEGNRLKQEALSTISHEFRTHLNAISNIANLLLNEKNHADQMEVVEVLKFSAENLMQLVNEILDYSRIDSGKLEFENIDFEIRKLMSGIEQSLRYGLIKNGSELDFVVDERVPEVIRGDSVRLAQILYNLVGNAIKFTAKGQVTVITTVTAEQENCVELLFTVTDTGIGIPEEKQQQIFEAFTQASSSTTRVYGGAGLGLAITKMLVELQGGTISLKSRVNEGSTFSVRLKFGKGSKNAGPKQPTREDSFNVFKGVRVLLVEDDAINQKIISKLLSSWGACLETASNGKIAVRMIRENKYQLVLMDLQMPEMDGFHTTMKIRNLKGNYFQELPILALTSSAFEEDLERICSSGMNGYVIKPFRPVDLNHKIFRMLDKRSLTLS